MLTFSRLMQGIKFLFKKNPAKWRRVRHECAHIAASIFGDFSLSEDQKLWRTDEQFLKQYKRLSPHNTYSQDRKFTLREFTRFVKDIPGELAECGCYQGASAFFMASVDESTTIHLFDSFEGLSEPTKNDNVNSPEQNIWKKGSLSTTEKTIRNNLKQLNNIKIYKGWIPNRFNEVDNISFKLVHIDVDLYQPTIDSLEFFYPRLVPGGVIVMDDYGFLTCPGAYKAASYFIKKINERIIHLPTGQGIILKSDKI